MPKPVPPRHLPTLRLPASQSQLASAASVGATECATRIVMRSVFSIEASAGNLTQGTPTGEVLIGQNTAVVLTSGTSARVRKTEARRGLFDPPFAPAVPDSIASINLFHKISPIDVE